MLALFVQVQVAVDDLNGNSPESVTAAGTGNTLAGFLDEQSAVGGAADQVSVFIQKLVWQPFKRESKVGAAVFKGVKGIAVAEDDQVEVVAVQSLGPAVFYCRSRAKGCHIRNSVKPWYRTLVSGGSALQVMMRRFIRFFNQLGFHVG